MKLSQLITLLSNYLNELGDVDAFEALYGTSIAAKLLHTAKAKVYKKGVTHDLTYSTWVAMHKRCLDPNHEAYKRYGGSGITICHRWLKYENFLADMGERPSKEITLDRINSSKGYSPDNCRWATWEQQTESRFVKNTEELAFRENLAKLCRRLNLDYSVILKRVQRGSSIEDAIKTPIVTRKRNASESGG